MELRWVEKFILYVLLNYLFVYHIYCEDEGCFTNVLIYCTAKILITHHIVLTLSDLHFKNIRD